MENSSSWLTALADPLSVEMRADRLGADLSLWPELAAGVSQLLRGETGLARTTLDEQYRAAANIRNGGAALLALALSWLAEARHFNCFPEGHGAGSVEINLRWNGVEKAQASHTLAQQARAWPGADAVQLPYRWLQFVAGRLSALVTARDARDHPQKDLVLQLHVQQCELARDDARALSTSALGFVERSIAELFGVVGERGRAEEALARATELYRVAGDDAGVASCLALRGDWSMAPASSALVRNLVIADATFPNSELTWNIEAVEGGVEDVDQPKGRALLEEALQLYERAGNSRGAASVLLRLAYIERIEGQYVRQIELTQKAQERFTAAGDPLHAHLALANHTLALLDARRLPANRDVAQTIGAWGNGPGSLSYTLGLGILFTRAGRQAMLREGDYEKAEACYQLALALNDALSAQCRSSQSQADLAALHQALGNRERSQTHREEAIDTLTKVDAADASIRGIVHQRAALLIQQLYREALDHRDAAGMEYALQRIEGLNPQDEGLAGFVVKSFLDETREQAAVLIPLYKAVDERNRGDDLEAERLFDIALAAARLAASGKKWLEAVVHAQRRHYGAAVQAFEDYQRGGAAFSGLSGTLLELMQSVSGPQAARELQIARRRSLEQSFSFMVRAKAYEQAAVHLRELEELDGPDWWTGDERPWRSLSDIAELHEGLGQEGKAVFHYQEALRIYELAIDQLEQRRSLLTRDELKTALAADFGVQYLYFQAVRAALRLLKSTDDPDQRLVIARRAFELSEKGRARALLDLLAANLRHPAGPAGESLELGKWRGLTSRIQLWRGMRARARGSEGSQERVDALRQKIEECEQELYELEQKMNRSEPRAGMLLSSAAHIASLDEVAARLAPGTVMLQYMMLGEELLMWGVTQHGMHNATIISLRATVLAGQVRKFQNSCAMGVPLESVRQQAAELSARLIGPILSAIEQHERLIITPYGDLNLLPFSTLLWREDWLGNQRTISYLPSASMLLLLPQASSDGAKTTLAVGNPQHMSHRPPFGVEESLPPLVHAETEAQSVAQLYGTRALIGPEATIEAIRPQLSRHRQLLFATHGVLYEEAPLLSGVALANGYVLTVQELMGLRLDADLITVSACKSGLGTRTGGEEIVGLTRGLLAAGARAVVVTLWPVLDLSTAVLMVRFHQHLKEGADPATALTQAQSWFRGLSDDALHQEKSKLRDLGVGEVKSLSSSHPQHWAPFIVIGA